MTAKRIGLVLAITIAALAAAYFSLRVHATRSYFGNAVVVTYDRPIVGSDSVTFTFNKPGTYVVGFIPSDSSDADHTPVPFVITIDRAPTLKVIKQAIPERMSITILSSNAAIEKHSFP